MASRGGDDGDDTQGVNEQGGVEYEDDGFGSANEPEPEGEELFDENVNRYAKPCSCILGSMIAERKSDFDCEI